ncbi:MAG: methyltransferase domain-containing protein, partial [Victivallales bacterium]|nr:methyltransferase domain-containing protein [Victivallales bacterium]
MITILTNTWETYELPTGSSGIVELDMGCGKGAYTLALAERYPERLVLASDVMLGRLRRLNRKIEKRHLDNARCLRASSLELVSFQLPPQSIDRIHLLCPDPWPKDKHVVKRLVTNDFLCRIPRILKVGGIL